MPPDTPTSVTAYSNNVELLLRNLGYEKELGIIHTDRLE